MSRNPGEPPRRPAAPPPPGSPPPPKAGVGASNPAPARPPSSAPPRKGESPRRPATPPEPSPDVYDLEDTELDSKLAKPAPFVPADEPPDTEMDPPPTRPKTSAKTSGGSSTYRKATGGPERPGKEPPREAGGPSFFERLILGSVGTGQLALFCRQFAYYYDAGVPLVKAMDSLQTQFARTALGPVIGRVGAAVGRGESLSEAMAREPKAFDRLFLSMIRVAEARGGVPETLKRMADHYEARRGLIRQAQSAMIYPIAVLTIAGGVIALLTIYILPMMFSALEIKADAIPLPARLMLAFSRFMQSYGWIAIPGAIVGGFFGIRTLYRTSGGKSILDELLLYVPVLGKLLSSLDTARFARTLSTLLEAGVDTPASLELTADVMHLAPFRKAVDGLRGAVLDGEELTDALAGSRRFPSDVLAVIESGEESGKLPESLEKVAEDYEERVTHMVKNLGQLVQPILMVILGGIVLFVVLAFFSAYVSSIQSLSAP